MNSLLSTVVVALCTLAAIPSAIASPVAPPQPDTNFSATCTNIGVNLSTLVLTATCQRSGGVGTTTSSIGLNSCISNTNGELTTGNGFSSSCQNIGFSGVNLSAQCKTPSGTFINTSIDLNVVFSNNNGLLTCP
ncbi:CNVH-domain-containing protein [Mycena venus]|uniref:CNVH-domain-containing protein n=1 Tax=Mycena venus TaxID=2733690 RepID=A0A8H6XP70_9AGAR|nr:CNVH-domain-containing protein [Mycena venus]